MVEKKAVMPLSQVEVLKKVDLVVNGLAPESPGEGTSIVVVSWASNGESFEQHDPPAQDVNVFGVFKSVSSNEFIIERGTDRYGVSEGALQGTHLSNESVPICPVGIAGILNSRGKRVWTQTSNNHGVINLGVVILNVGYSDNAANEAELLDRLHDWAVDAHEDVFAEYSTIINNLDRLVYKTSGGAIGAWIDGFKKRVELDLNATDRGEWSPHALDFVSYVKSVADYSIVLALGNDVIGMMGLEIVTPPATGYGYRDYSNNLVPLSTGDSGIGQEFFMESDNGKIGLRVLGCNYNSGPCGSWFTHYDVDLTRIRIKEPCVFVLIAQGSRADMRMLRQVREFRDQYLAAFPRGKMYIDLYRAHTFEMWRLAATDPEIRKQARALLPQVVRLIKTWRESEPARLDQATIDGIKKLANIAKNRASAQLCNSIKKVLPDLEKFKEQSLGEILLILQEFDFPKE